MKYFITLFLIGYSFLAQSQESKNKKTIATAEYSIEYPASWSENRTGIAEASFFLFSKLTNESDKFRENVNLVIQDLSDYELSLQEYAEISENQVKTLVTDSQIQESKQYDNNGLKFHKIIYTGKQGVFDLKFEQYYWLINKKAYVLTFTCEESQFPIFKKEGEAILNSFRIL